MDDIQVSHNLVEQLSSRFHDIYQKEVKRQAKYLYHHDDYDELDDDVKELDRVLARWVLAHFTPLFKEEIPPA